MADVLIVCVREDEPQAKALADMFEAAGFSIGGAPNSDGALRSSGAGVVVWSQASIRSRPFLDAAGHGRGGALPVQRRGFDDHRRGARGRWRALHLTLT